MFAIVAVACSWPVPPEHLNDYGKSLFTATVSIKHLVFASDGCFTEAANRAYCVSPAGIPRLEA